jgi:anti-sigma regulatory factor (Ser/Thr protein kinase)
MITTMRERTFEPTAAQIRAARAFAVDSVPHEERRAFGDRVALVVSELASNAVLHARTAFTVRVAASGGTVRVAVGDRSAVPPVGREPDTSAVTGRGLAIVDALSSRWGVETGADGIGKWVWAELERSDDELA